MKNISLLILLGIAVYFLLIRKAGATYADSGGADIGNPLYFSLGKIMADSQTLSYDGLQKLKRREAFSSIPYNDQIHGQLDMATRSSPAKTLRK
jgi:hypothetical protein